MSSCGDRENLHPETWLQELFPSKPVRRPAMSIAVQKPRSPRSADTHQCVLWRSPSSAAHAVMHGDEVALDMDLVLRPGSGSCAGLARVRTWRVGPWRGRGRSVDHLTTRRRRLNMKLHLPLVRDSDMGIARVRE